MDSAKCEVFLTAVDMGSLTAAAEFLETECCGEYRTNGESHGCG